MSERPPSPRARLVGLAQRMVPPGLLSAAKRVGLYPWGFRGDFSSWQEARQAAGGGYEDPAVAESVAAGTRELMASVQPGQVPTPTSTLRLLAAFLLAIRGKGSEIRVADFGGALGAHYFAFRALVPAVRLAWVVHETSALCEVGRQQFATDGLSFAPSLDEAREPADVVLASGSLQYLEQPLATFGKLSTRAPFLIVDRLPLSRQPRDRIALQVVPPWIHAGARFPVWFLSQETWARETQGRVLLSWECEERVQLRGEEIAYRGFLLRGQAAD